MDQQQHEPKDWREQLLQQVSIRLERQEQQALRDLVDGPEQNNQDLRRYTFQELLEISTTTDQQQKHELNEWREQLLQQISIRLERQEQQALRDLVDGPEQQQQPSPSLAGAAAKEVRNGTTAGGDSCKQWPSLLEEKPERCEGLTATTRGRSRQETSASSFQPPLASSRYNQYDCTRNKPTNIQEPVGVSLQRMIGLFSRRRH